MSQQNSLAPFINATNKDLLNAIGITQFTSETNWYQVIGGLIIQGGFIDNAATATLITLNTSFTKQVLGVFITSVTSGATDSFVSAVTVDDFVINFAGGGTRDFYWHAIGV